MPTIVMTPTMNKLDGTLKRKAWAFIEKLTTSDDTLGLHIEPINNSVDSRVRTGRVDQQFRAVLFKIQGSGPEAYYVLHGVWNHDEAIEIAKKSRLSVNPVNGVLELVQEEPVAPPAPRAEPVQPAVAASVSNAEQSVVSSDAAIAPETAVEPVLRARGISLADLTDVLGIDRDLAAGAVEATSDDALSAVADRAADQVIWQGIALLEIAAGSSVREVQQSLELERAAVALDSSDDDAVIAALQRPASRTGFSVLDDDELRRAIEEKSFDAWRVFLHPEQRDYAERRRLGPFRLSGGAGTGKTVVLIHRARSLARANPDARILVTTYTRNLADALKADLLRLDPSIVLSSKLGEPGVFVAGIDAVAAAVLRDASDLSGAAREVLGVDAAGVAKRTNKNEWTDALESAGQNLPTDARSVPFLQAEYALIVLPNRITSREEYWKARRPGRGVKLDRAKRSTVWDVVETYRRRSRLDGTIDFEEAPALAAAALEQSGQQLCDHVLVDEGQDLTPTRWQLLRALVASGPDDLFIAEDSQQRIYGRQVVLGRYGIGIVGRSRRLTLNYRTTAENLAFAVGVLSGASFTDVENTEAVSAGYRSARRGPEPILIGTETVSEELQAAADLVAGWLSDGLEPETVAVLTRDQRQRHFVMEGLRERGVQAREVDAGEASVGLPLVMTMHRAKGTEFSNVLLFGLGARAMPSPVATKGLTDSDLEDALLRERSLLYVAATRARDQLACTWNGERTRLLPEAVEH